MTSLGETGPIPDLVVPTDQVTLPLASFKDMVTATATLAGEAVPPSLATVHVVAGDGWVLFEATDRYVTGRVQLRLPPCCAGAELDVLVQARALLKAVRSVRVKVPRRSTATPMVRLQPMSGEQLDLVTGLGSEELGLASPVGVPRAVPLLADPSPPFPDLGRIFARLDAETADDRSAQLDPGRLAQVAAAVAALEPDHQAVRLTLPRDVRKPALLTHTDEDRGLRVALLLMPVRGAS